MSRLPIINEKGSRLSRSWDRKRAPTMRDLIVFLIVAGSLPLILVRPYIGILVWSWLGYMNPHRLTWGFAYEMPFAQIVGITTLLSFVFTKYKVKLPINTTTVIWIMFVAWFSLTSLFALDAEDGYAGWDRAAKIQLISFLTMFLVYKREHIQALIWVVVCSLGFYGIKGGIFVILGGGKNRVFGPADSFIGDNNALALALIMTLPLMSYLYFELNERWQKNAMIVLMSATGVAVLGSHSRGAALAGACMLLFLMLKSSNKIRVGLTLALLVSLGLSVMPQQWFDRMQTVKTYEQDSSAMGRITAWKFATQLAIKRPIGGGFGAFVEENYRRYSPEISQRIDERDGRFQGAHSIYFRVLGEHGFFGLALFLGLGMSAYLRARAVQRAVVNRPDLLWAGNLSRMLQVSLIGYAVGGAFLGLSYFDLYYHLIALIIIVQSIVRTSDNTLP